MTSLPGWVVVGGVVVLVVVAFLIFGHWNSRRRGGYAASAFAAEAAGTCLEGLCEAMSEICPAILGAFSDND